MTRCRVIKTCDLVAPALETLQAGAIALATMAPDRNHI